MSELGLGLIPLAGLMWLCTYPSRALPMLAPGIEHLPAWAVAYLRFGLTLGVVPVAVALCALVVARTRQLLPGVAAAVVLVAATRALGVAA